MDKQFNNQDIDWKSINAYNQNLKQAEPSPTTMVIHNQIKMPNLIMYHSSQLNSKLINRYQFRGVFDPDEEVFNQNLA